MQQHRLRQVPVSRDAPIRPIQSSTLKAFDPLDEGEERGEDNDRYADIEKSEHGDLLGVPEGVGRHGLPRRAAGRCSDGGQARCAAPTRPSDTPESGKRPHA